MRRSLRLVAGLLHVALLLPAVSAQISVGAVTKSSISGSAWALYAQPSTSYFHIPANTDVSAGYARGASSYGGLTGSSASCTSTLTVNNGTSLLVELKESSSGSGRALYASYYAITGSNEVVVTLRSKTPIAGRLDLSTQTRGQIDIGHDGSFDLAGTDSASMDAVIGPTGLQFLLRGSSLYGGSGLGGGTDSASATLRFTPAQGNMSILGAPCRGPVLESYFLPNSPTRAGFLTLEASQVPASNMSLIAFGTSDPGVMIPPFGCPLLTDVLIGVGVPSVNGAARLHVPILPSVRLPRAVTVRMQFLIVSGGGWVSSNGIALKLN